MKPLLTTILILILTALPVKSADEHKITITDEGMTTSIEYDVNVSATVLPSRFYDCLRGCSCDFEDEKMCEEVCRGFCYNNL